MNRPLMEEVIAWIKINPECVDIGTCCRPYADCHDTHDGQAETKQHRNSLVTVILHLTESPVIGRDGNQAHSPAITADGYAYTEAMYTLGLTKAEMDILDHRFKGAWPRPFETALEALTDTYTRQILDPKKYGEVVAGYLKWFVKNYPAVQI